MSIHSTVGQPIASIHSTVGQSIASIHSTVGQSIVLIHSTVGQSIALIHSTVGSYTSGGIDLPAIGTIYCTRILQISIKNFKGFRNV